MNEILKIFVELTRMARLKDFSGTLYYQDSLRAALRSKKSKEKVVNFSPKFPLSEPAGEKFMTDEISQNVD